VSVQRVRIWFRKGERVRYISHLDVLRYWERAFRRAELPLAYSQGFTPHPKLAFAGPLPLGFVADAEIVDATLDERVALGEVAEKLGCQSSEDLAMVSIREVPLGAPPPQNLVVWADYAVDLPGVDPGTARSTVSEFLAREAFEWVDERREKPRAYDLRAGVARLTVEPSDCGVRLRGRMSATQDFTVRPEQLVLALFGDAEPLLITREALVLAEHSPARAAWRSRGRFES
jgi:radical SAM-linked protein